MNYDINNNMKKKIENHKKSSEKCNRSTYQSVYIKGTILCEHNSDSYIETARKLKKCNICSIHALLSKLFNLPLTLTHNMCLLSFIKLIGIYKLFILQFTVAMAQSEGRGEEGTDCTHRTNGDNGGTEAYQLLTKVNDKLCPLCTAILQEYKQYCGQYYLGIVVPLVTLIVLILFFQYICIKCCRSSKSRKNKKKEADLRMNSFEPRYERPHRHMYHGHVYGESMQQSNMFPGDRMHPNKHRQPFMYQQA
ncbi:hypothetical protein PGO_003870, partial [Plasmodium gonderi]